MADRERIRPSAAPAGAALERVRHAPVLSLPAVVLGFAATFAAASEAPSGSSIVPTRLVPQATQAGPAVLGPRTDLATLADPRSLAVQDLDGNGHPDLVVACTSANHLSVFLGAGGGAFAPRVDVDVGASPTAVVALDWNHDGYGDVAMALGGPSPRVVVELGDGIGALHEGASATIPGTCAKLVSGDFNGDGIVDVAGVTELTPSLAFLLPGTAGGAFGTLVPLTAPEDPGAVCVSIAAARFDADTTLDLATIRRCATCSSIVYSGASSWKSSIGNVPGTVDAAALDYDLDARTDVLVAGDSPFGPTGALWIWKNSYPLAFATGGYVDLPAFAAGIAVSDLDSNLVPDAVVTHPATDSITVVLFACGNPGVVELQSYDAGPDPGAVLCADLDGDGRAEVIVANSGGASISIRSTGGVTAPACLPDLTSWTGSLDFGTGPVQAPSVLAIRLVNGGPAPLGITAVSIDNPEFQLACCVPPSVPPGFDVQLLVTYQRQAPGSASGTATISTNDPDHPTVLCALSGSAYAGQVEVEPPPAPPTLRSGESMELRLTIHNPQAVPVDVQATLDSIVVGGAPVGWPNPGPAGTTVPLPWDFVGPGSARWDVQSNGSIATGADGAFQGGLVRIGYAPSSTARLESGNREAVIGPNPGLYVQRRVFVSPSAPFARWYEVFGNPGNSKATYTLDVLTSFGGPLLTPTGGPGWVVVDDGVDNGGRPAVAQVYGATRTPITANATAVPPQSRFTWQLDVGPRGMAAIAHFAVQAGTGAEAASIAQQLASLGVGALDGLGSTERRLLATDLPVDPFRMSSFNSRFAAGESRELVITFGASMFLGLPADASCVLHVRDIANPAPAVRVPLSFQVVALEDTVSAPIGVPDAGKPQALALRGFVPNPLPAAGGVLECELPGAGPAHWAVYDVRGRLLWSRSLAAPRAGRITVPIGAGELRASGVVWIRVEQEGRVATGKGIVLP